MGMLILTRRVNESICIGPNKEIVVAILGVKGGQVRVGIDAPPSIVVDRQEIFERKQKEKSAKDEAATA